MARVLDLGYHPLASLATADSLITADSPTRGADRPIRGPLLTLGRTAVPVQPRLSYGGQTICSPEDLKTPKHLNRGNFCQPLVSRRSQGGTQGQGQERSTCHRLGGRPVVACGGPRKDADQSGGSMRSEGVDRRSVLIGGAAGVGLTLLEGLLPSQWEGSVARALTTGAQGDVEEQVRAAVRKVLSRPKAAGILRLVFHDAGTYDLATNSGGMNGSLLYELERPENGGLKRAIRVLEKARLEMDPTIEVSWADLMAVAGTEAVSICGGPTIEVQLGRQDANGPDPEGRMPAETLSVAELKESFVAKGISTREMVVLSGAHTLGSKGFGDPVKFDTAYFSTLVDKPWERAAPGDQMAQMIGIPSDRVIAYDEECREWINFYAASEERFFTDFKAAYQKLVNSGATWRVA